MVKLYKEDITWLRGDTNFIFDCGQYLSQVSAANEWEILSAREDKICIPSGHVMFCLLYRYSDQMSWLNTVF